MNRVYKTLYDIFPKMFYVYDLNIDQVYFA